MKAKSLGQLSPYFSICLLLWAWQVQAKDLGTYGATFEIQEPDLLQVIESKLTHLQKSGQLRELQKQWQQQAKSFLENPNPVKNIQYTKKPRTFYYDPSIILSEDLTDHQGKLIRKVGTRVNPLKTTPLTQALLFLDGDDIEQVAWAQQEAKQRNGKVVLVLVKGHPLKLMKDTRQRFYFDQAGSLVGKVGIQQVPAIVTQAGLMLKVEEVNP